MFYRNRKIKKYGYVNTLRLELGLVRALGLGDSAHECFINRCYESLQIGFPIVLSRGPHLDFEAMDAVIQIWKFGVHKTRQKTTPN